MVFQMMLKREVWGRLGKMIAMLGIVCVMPCRVFSADLVCCPMSGKTHVQAAQEIKASVEKGVYHKVTLIMSMAQMNVTVPSLKVSKVMSDSVSSSQDSWDGAINVSQEMIQAFQRGSETLWLDRGIMMNLVLILVLGLFLAFAIIAIINKFDDRISSVTELYERLGQPILAQIPQMQIPRGTTRLALLQAGDDRNTLAESYRNLRSSLLFLPSRQKVRSLVITSSVPQEGKSTVAANLAITMALAETHVLLVDADLRLGHLASDFGLRADVGVSDVLEKRVDWREALLQTPIPHLHLLPCGKPMQHPGNFLISEHFAAVMEKLEEHYSIVIYDTTSILASDDTVSLASRSDGVVMVFRASYTSSVQARRGLETLAQRQIPLLGMVLNGVADEVSAHNHLSIGTASKVKNS